MERWREGEREGGWAGAADGKALRRRAPFSALRAPWLQRLNQELLKARKRGGAGLFLRIGGAFPRKRIIVGGREPAREPVGWVRFPSNVWPHYEWARRKLPQVARQFNGSK